MKLLDFYIARSVIVGVIAALFIIASIDWLGDLFYLAGKMSEGDRVSNLIIVTLLDFPHKLFEFLPSALLIGALLGLGQLAASSELVACGASGLSRFRVAVVSCLVGLLFTLLVVAFVELSAPAGDRIAARFQQGEQEDNVLLASDESYWVRGRKHFVRIGNAVSPELLRNITIYSFNDEGGIGWIGQADIAIREDNQWNLTNFRRSYFNENRVRTQVDPTFSWPEVFLTNALRSMTSDPFKLSLRRLTENIAYLNDNHLDATSYRVALFKKIAVPFTGLSMLLLALPLVFRPRQLGGLGQRMFAGIVMALIIYVAIEATMNGAVVYRVSPILAAFFPVLVITALSVIGFRFTR